MTTIHFHLFVFKSYPARSQLSPMLDPTLSIVGPIAIPILPCPELLIAINQTYNIK